MKLIEPAAIAAATKGTKRQKSTLLRHWSMFYATYGVDIQAFGKKPVDQIESVREGIRRDIYVLAGLASFDVLYPRK